MTQWLNKNIVAICSILVAVMLAAIAWLIKVEVSSAVYKEKIDSCNKRLDIIHQYNIDAKSDLKRFIEKTNISSEVKIMAAINAVSYRVQMIENKQFQMKGN